MEMDGPPAYSKVLGPMADSDRKVDLWYGQIVWVLFDQYPWWPARLLDTMFSATGEDLEQARWKHQGKFYVVFYNDNGAGAWVAPTDMRPMSIQSLKDYDVSSVEESLRKQVDGAIREALEFCNKMCASVYDAQVLEYAKCTQKHFGYESHSRLGNTYYSNVHYVDNKRPRESDIVAAVPISPKRALRHFKREAAMLSESSPRRTVGRPSQDIPVSTRRSRQAPISSERPARSATSSPPLLPMSGSHGVARVAINGQQMPPRKRGRPPGSVQQMARAAQQQATLQPHLISNAAHQQQQTVLHMRGRGLNLASEVHEYVPEKAVEELSALEERIQVLESMVQKVGSSPPEGETWPPVSELPFNSLLFLNSLARNVPKAGVLEEAAKNEHLPLDRGLAIAIEELCQISEQFLEEQRARSSTSSDIKRLVDSIVADSAKNSALYQSILASLVLQAASW